MTIREDRWLLAWHLLSLDRVSPFSWDLGFAVEDQQRFLSELRRQLQEGLDSLEFGQRPGKLHSRLAKGFVATYGQVGFDFLTTWVSSIFIQGGPDRFTESVWLSLIQYLGRRGLPRRDQLQKAIQALRESVNERNDRLDDRLATQKDAVPSAWDQRLVQICYPDIFAVDRSIRLISSSNHLLLAWHEHCGHLNLAQLTELHDSALEVASEAGWHEPDISFPGSWIFELGPFIARIAEKKPIPLIR